MSKSKLLNLLLALALLLPSMAFAQANHLVNDTFSDTDRIGGTDGSVTTSAEPAIGTITSTNTQWVINRVSQLVASSTGMLWTMDTTSNTVAIGYFPEVTVAAGVQTTFTLNFTTGDSGTDDNNLRFALLNGTPLGLRTTDGFGSTDDTFGNGSVGDVGYGVFSSSSNIGGGATTNLVLRTNQRFTVTNDLLGAAAGWGNNTDGNTYFGASSGATGYLAPNTAYELKLILNYDGSALSITTSLTGGNFVGMTYTVTDAVDPTLTFNQFAIRFGGGSNQFSTIKLNGFSVSTPIAPAITTQPSPASQTVSVGANVTYAVVATGTPALAYQWKKDGVNVVDSAGHIAGATTDTLTLTSAQTADAGDYTVVVSNAASTAATSNAATLIVQTPPVAPTATAATGTTSSGFTANWDSVTGATGYWLDVSTDNAFGSYVTGYENLAVGNVLSRAVTGLAAGTQYFYRVRADNGVTGSSSGVIAVTTDAAGPALVYLVNDTFSDADRIGGTDGSATTSAEPAIGTITSTNTQWVVNRVSQLVASSTGMLWTMDTTSNTVAIGYFPEVTVAAGVQTTFTLNFTTGASGTDDNNLRIALLNGTPGGLRTTDGFGSTDATFGNGTVGDVGYGVFSSSSNIGGGATANLVLRTNQRFTVTSDLLSASAGWGNNTDGNTYFGASSGATGYLAPDTAYELKLVLNYDGSVLSITTSLTGGNFSGMNYTVTDAVDPTLTFNQFAIRFGGGSNQFSNIKLNGFSVTTPAPVTAPAITTQPSPASQTVNAGSNVAYSVVATGTAPLSYQWKKDGVNVVDSAGHIAGASTDTLTLTSVQAADAGDYTVVVSNAAAPAATSNAATLIVQSPPAATAATAASALTSGGFTANWSSVSGATGYRLDVSTDSAFGSFVSGYENLNVGPVLARAVTGLSPSTTYYFRVRAYNGAGASASSNTITATTEAAGGGTAILHDQLAATAPNAGLSTDANGFLVPTSTQMAWASFGSANIAYVQGATLGLSAGSTRGLMAYFSPSTSLATIAEGETLSATVKFTFTGGTLAQNAGNFRIGLLNSGGNGTASNGFLADGVTPISARYAPAVSNSLTGSPTGNTARAYTGYIADTMAATTSSENSQSFWFRTPTATNGGGSTQILGPTGSSDLSETGTFSQIGTTGGGTAGALMNDGTIYTLTFSITHVSATEMKLEYSVKSGSTTVMAYSVDQTTGTFVTSFDSLMIFSTYGAAPAVTELLIAKSAQVVAPTITTQPSGQTVTVGSNATLTVAATGTTPLGYQWQKDGADVTDGGRFSGATTSTLTVTGAQLADAGNYRVVVSNTAAAIVSAAATIDVTAAPVPPTITTQPSSTAAYVGDTVSFTAVASGSTPLSYQWKTGSVDLTDGARISGATTATLTLSDLELADAGSYVLTVTNGAGTSDSDPAVLTVTMPPPTIVTQPQTQSALTGTRVTFSVRATGPGPMSYQWAKGGTALTGETGQTLTLTNLSSSDAGNYAVIVSNENGVTPSAAAALTIVTPAATLPAQPTIPAGVFKVTDYGAVADGTTNNAAAIQSAIAAAVAAGGGTVEFTPAAGAYLSGPITLASNINLQIDGGATLKPLPYGTYSPGTTHFITVPSGSSHVAITGTGTIDGDGAAWWAAYEANNGVARPRLIQFTRASNVFISGITLTNSPNFGIAFSSGGTDVTIFGLTITAPASSPNTDGIDPAGTNFLIQKCSISVGDDNIAVKPGNAFCSNITIADCDFGTGHGLSIGGQTNLGLDGMNVLNCRFNGTTSGLRMKADATQGGALKNVTYANITMTNVQYPIVFYSYYNQIGNPGTTSSSSGITPAKVNEWNATPPNPLNTSTLPSWKDIRIENLTSTRTTGALGYSIIWGLPTTDGLIANVTLHNVNISGHSGFKIYDAANVQFTGTTDVGTVTTANTLAITGQPQNQTVAAGGTVSFSVTTAGTSGVNATAPTYRWSFNGVPLSDGVQRDGSTVAGATTATLTLSSARGGNIGAYSCTVSNQLDGYNVAAGALAPDSLPVSATSSAATLAVNYGTGVTPPVIPTITTQPASQSVNIGGTATFEAAATSAGAITASQWQKQAVDETWVDIANATSFSLTLATLQVADAGNYRILVWNEAGPVSSSVATLTVVTPPVITQVVQDPDGSSVIFEGEEVTLTVTATGTAPFTYQWKKDGTDLANSTRISGATGATLTLSPAEVADSGSYTVVLTNPAGTATSTAVALTITAIPTAPPAPVAVAATGITTSRFLAQWNSAPTATGYRLDVSTQSDFSSFVTDFQNLDVGDSLNRYVTNLVAGTAYYYRVRAVNVIGTSPNSNAITATTAAAMQAPVFTSAATTTFTFGLPSSFTVTASGIPAPTFSATGMPAWLTLDAATGLLSGTPPASTSASQFLLMITAENGVAPEAVQAFTLSIQPSPGISTPMTITTFAGTALASGSTDATGAAARFNHVSGVRTDNLGNIYAADTDNHVIRRITPEGVVTTFAGTAGLTGTTNGTGAAARFNSPTGLAVDNSGNVYVADTLNHTIRKISSTGSVTTVAGSGGASGSVDAGGTTARFSAPQGLALAPDGTALYIADTNNHAIRKFDLASLTAEVTTLAGVAGQSGSADGNGSAARFNAPSDLAVDVNGNLYVADTDNNTIRVVTPAGEVRTLAGVAGGSGAADGTAGSARFNHPSALVVDGDFNVFVLDTDNHAIRKIASAAGVVTTVAGQAGSAGSADGAGATARFNFPVGIARAPDGAFYIADTNNHTLRRGVFPGAPVIQTQPQSQSVTAGATVQFFVSATGQPPPTYQWLLNGSPMNGATGSTLTLSNVAVAQSARYSVVVTNANGSVTSNEATLTVSAPPPVGGVSGGGGAPSTWFLLALAALAAGRWASSRRNALSLRSSTET